MAMYGSRDPRRLAVPSHVAMSYSPPRTPINPRGFAIVAKLVSKETLNTATAKVASLETSVWHFGRTVGLLSVQRDQRDGKEYDELLSGYYFKYGKRVWKADDHPELTFWQAGMRAGGVVEYHGIQPGGEMQVTEIKRKRAWSGCFKDVLGKVCPCSWWILMDPGSHFRLATKTVCSGRVCWHWHPRASGMLRAEKCQKVPKGSKRIFTTLP